VAGQSGSENSTTKRIERSFCPAAHILAVGSSSSSPSLATAPTPRASLDAASEWTCACSPADHVAVLASSTFTSGLTRSWSLFGNHGKEGPDHITRLLL
jgi:hypothetical protein